MDAVIRKWGNSPALRQPSEKVEYDLDALISGINAKNSHAEVNFGAPVGNEAL